MGSVEDDSMLKRPDDYLKMTWLDYVLKSGLTIEEFALILARDNHINSLKKLFLMVESLDEMKIMHVAAEANSGDVLIYMLQQRKCNVKGKHLGETVLHRAVIKNSLRTVDYVLENFPDLLDAKNNRDETALHCAAKIGNLSTVERLMKRGAHVNAGFEGLDAPLHLAVRGNHVKALRILSNYKPDINVGDVDGNKPIILGMKNHDVLSFLDEANPTVRINFHN